MGDTIQQWRGAIGCFTALPDRAKAVRKRRKKSDRLFAVPVSKTVSAPWKNPVTFLLLTSILLLRLEKVTMDPVVYVPETSPTPLISTSSTTSMAVSSNREVTKGLGLQVKVQPGLCLWASRIQNQAKEREVSVKSFSVNITKLHPIKLVNNLSVKHVKRLIRLCNDVETNPGPNPNCCKAKDKFNRIENVIKQEKSNFLSKVAPGTMIPVCFPGRNVWFSYTMISHSN